MNSYLVRTSQKLGIGTVSVRIVKADSVKEAIIKTIEKMGDLKETEVDISLDVTLMEVIE